MARVLFFGPVRQCVGEASTEVHATTVGEALEVLGTRYGAPFTELLVTCRYWVDGRPAESEDHLGEHDELSVLPPVSGG